jgi:hypothetical protein
MSRLKAVEAIIWYVTHVTLSAPVSTLRRNSAAAESWMHEILTRKAKGQA